MIRLVTAVSFALALSVVAAAQEPAKADAPVNKEPAKDLLVGEKAPPLSIEKWIKGDPIAKFESGKLYVVEFWATWCGPCIQVQPHLSELQKKYKDKGVTFIGLTSEDPNNSLAAVEKMVKERDDKMAYTIAWDKGRDTNRAYMEGAAQMGIPCAFLIDQEGTLAWVGHPMELDGPLDEVIAKKWDIKKAAEKFKTEFDDSKEEMKFQQAAEESMEQIEKLQAAMQQSDFAAAQRIVDELIDKKPVMAARLSALKVQLHLQAKEFDKAYALTAQIAEKHFAKKPGDLAELSRMLLDVEPAEKRNADLALTLAKKAGELAPERGEVLDALSSAYAAKNDFAKAVETQKALLALAEKQKAPEEVMTELKSRLKEYETKAGGSK